MIRNSTKYVSYKDLKEVTTDLKKIYSATNEEEGSSELEKFTKKWDDKYPVISDIWRRNWSGISPLFAFPEEIRKAIYTTNIIEAANRQITGLLTKLYPLANLAFLKKLQIERFMQLLCVFCRIFRQPCLKFSF